MQGLGVYGVSAIDYSCAHEAQINVGDLTLYWTCELNWRKPKKTTINNFEPLSIYSLFVSCQQSTLKKTVSYGKIFLTLAQRFIHIQLYCTMYGIRYTHNWVFSSLENLILFKIFNFRNRRICFLLEHSLYDLNIEQDVPICIEKCTVTVIKLLNER